MREEGVGRDGLAVPHDQLADEAVLGRGEGLVRVGVGVGVGVRVRFRARARVRVRIRVRISVRVRVRVRVRVGVGVGVRVNRNLDCEQIGRGGAEASPLHRPTEAVLLPRLRPAAEGAVRHSRVVGEQLEPLVRVRVRVRVRANPNPNPSPNPNPNPNLHGGDQAAEGDHVDDHE